ncbi:MAG: aminotransferase class I/II-fold pyridoxal phosphate-dependent enzyme [Candidatus Hydrogenedentota bacterium]
MCEFRFNTYGRACTEPAPVNRMMAEFATGFRDGVDVNLGVGYVNERTIPRDWLGEAMDAVVSQPDQHRQAFNYGGSQGSPNLHAALRAFLLRSGLGQLDAATLARQALVIGPSGATSVLEAVADLLEPGLVITADPMYYIYCNYLERKGFRVVTVPEDEAGLDPDALAATLDGLGEAVTDLAFFYVVTVNNPSCTILSNERRQRLTEMAADTSRRLGRTVPIFFDQAYEWLLHDPAMARPISPLMTDTAAVAYEVGTLSKIVAPGLRIGYLLGPDSPLIDAVAQKTSDVGFSAPLITQEMAAWFIEHRIDGQLTAVNAGYREKAQAVRESIGRHLGPAVTRCRGGRAGFYFYLTLDGIRTDTGSPFFQFLTRTTGNPAVDGPAGAPYPRVIYIPGEYCVHPAGPCVAAGRNELRISYGFEEADVIDRALGHMRAALDYARMP